MNKELAIEKINKIGKAGKIIVRIGKIFTVLGLTFCLAAAIVLSFLPKNSISYKTSSDFQLIIDMYKLTNGEVTDADINKTVEYAENNMNISVNNIDYNDMDAEVEGNNVIINADSESNRIDLRKSMREAAILGMIYLVLLLVTLFFLEPVFKNIEKCESPFSDAVVVSLNRFAYSLIPWVFGTTLGNAIASVIAEGTMNLHISVNISSLLMVLVVFALAYIFKYGTALQQESDETL